MNKIQRIILGSIGVLSLLMLLFPPFEITVSSGTFSLGYGFIFSPPANGSSVNIGMLLLQWAMIVFSGAVGWFLLKDKE